MGDRERTIALLAHLKDNPVLTNSGYAKVARYVTPHLLDAGYEVRLHCPVGHQNNVMEWNDPEGRRFEIWTGGDGPYGENIVPAHMNRLLRETGKHAMLLFCGDIPAVNQIPEWARKREILAAAWAAVDWEWPTPKHALDKFNAFYRVFPMSEHGTAVLGQDGATNTLPAVHLGVDTEVWKPDDRRKYPKVMESMGYSEEGFNVFSCFANQWLRKGEYEMFQAIGEFHKRHPEAKIHLYAHTQVRREWDFAALVEHLGLKGLVTLSDDYAFVMGDYPEQDVAMMMNAADCVMSLGYEGFGLQTVEAQALNKPIIGFNAGATPELLLNGILVPPERDFMVATMFRRPLMDGPKVVDALEYVWQHQDDKQRWGKGRAHVERCLTWKHTGRALVDRLEAIEQALADEEILAPPPPGPLGVELAAKRIEVTPE